MRVLRISLLVVLSVLSLGFADGSKAANPQTNPVCSTDLTELSQASSIGPLEVRIRRLHRVRPDLMSFPIQYDTFC